jgi:hypothetical protein
MLAAVRRPYLRFGTLPGVAPFCRRRSERFAVALWLALGLAVEGPSYGWNLSPKFHIAWLRLVAGAWLSRQKIAVLCTR